MSVPWPVTALPGRRPGEGQGDLINAYGCKIGDTVQIRRTPGLQRALAVGDATLLPPRGMHGMPTRLIHVWGDEVHSWDGTTDTTLTGTPIASADRVTFASNLRTDPVPDLVIVSDVAAYFVDLDPGTVAAYPDGDLGSVTSVEYFSGYFFFTRSNGQIVASDLQNTDIDPLSVATAEYASDPLIRLKSTGSALLAFGSRSIEAWVDVGSSPFPLQRQTALDIGLLGQWAVAGGANEWGNGILFVASDYSVRWMDGLTPKVVSNDDVAHDVFLQRNNVDGIVAQVYEFEGQAVFSITTDSWTWEYNLITGAWHRRDSYGQANWRATSCRGLQLSLVRAGHAERLPVRDPPGALLGGYETHALPLRVGAHEGLPGLDADSKHRHRLQCGARVDRGAVAVRDRSGGDDLLEP